jgi:Na+:H+ antiporter
MTEISSYIFILAICLLVILSYLYHLLSQKTGIPSVLLLLATGIIVREILIYKQTPVAVPPQFVEICGIVGLIMIILEAGLDIQISRNKFRLVRNAFFSAFIILVLSAIVCSLLLYFYLKEDYLNCLIYSLPLSIVSSAIVIPSISHLDDIKKEFLVYETSFSDIIGILIFNYLIAGNLLKGWNITWFFGSIALSIFLSLALSGLMLLMLTHISSKVRFFLVFAVLIFLYAGGKMLSLPSLIIILIFGLVVSNWHIPLLHRFHRYISNKQVYDVSHLLHSLTAESSFLIRTFFFFIFGLTIDLKLLIDTEVILAGSAIVILLLGIRYIYLKFFLHAHIFPELFFMPRGLITILLFYSIPEFYQLSKFNEGILFFIILISNIIMMIGSIAYGRPRIQTISDELPLSKDNI